MNLLTNVKLALKPKTLIKKLKRITPKIDGFQAFLDKCFKWIICNLTIRSLKLLENHTYLTLWIIHQNFVGAIFIIINHLITLLIAYKKFLIQ